jgi:dihydropteroate synthase
MFPSSLSERYPQRATSWKLRTRTLQLGRRPMLMGIVNVTPDSFSDGGKHYSTTSAIEHGLRLLDEGADILDVGGESTRPYSTPVDDIEELKRVEPVIRGIAKLRPEAILSIDTSKHVVGSALIDVVEIFNDIRGFQGKDGLLLATCAREHGQALCTMHMQGTPQTMQDNPRYDNVMEEVFSFLRARREELLAMGIEREKICLDPGVGFGKTHQHNLTLMAHCGRFHDLGCPLLVGHSRKGFIGKLIGDKEADRTAGTIGSALALAQQGVQIIRVHDVRAVREALLLFEACGGIDGVEATLYS